MLKRVHKQKAKVLGSKYPQKWIRGSSHCPAHSVMPKYNICTRTKPQRGARRKYVSRAAVAGCGNNSSAFMPVSTLGFPGCVVDVANVTRTGFAPAMWRVMDIV
jgi:hypothetical protein